MKFRLTCMLLLVSIFVSFTSMAYFDQPKVDADTDLIQLMLSKIEQDESIFQINTSKKYMPPRYLYPERIPYVFNFFNDLYQDPLMVYPFTKFLEKATLDYFNPDYTSDDILYHMLFYFGVDKIDAGVHRDYLSVGGLEPVNTSLIAALEKVYEVAGEKTRYWTYGNYSPNMKEEINKQIKKLSPHIQKPIASLLINIVEAYKWNEIATRNIDNELLWKVYKNRDIPMTISDGGKYYPEIVDLESALDKSVFYYASQLLAYSTMTATQELQAAVKYASKLDIIEITTPLGRVVVSGPQNDIHDYAEALLVIDFGGDDTYSGRIAANAGPDLPISICIDISGNDLYENTDQNIASQGSGIVGHGVLVDLDGNDTYKSHSFSQGLGFFGTGILYDKNGDDKYENMISGQGCGYFGIGLCLDQTGDDKYYITYRGQGNGNSGGIGALINYSGNDEYVAERYEAEKNPNGLLMVGSNHAQGAGSGRRGDVTDGSAWAGGLGIIMDIEGDDIYTAGNYSIGVGYWFGTGICYDKNGNDTYNSTYTTQGSVCHFSIGALIDESGDDKHNLYDEKTLERLNFGNGLGFGWDGGAGIFIDRGGNDTYQSAKASFGTGYYAGRGYFIDESGDDVYIAEETLDGFGANFVHDFCLKPSLKYGYLFKEVSSSLNMFIDAGGEDCYKYWTRKTGLEPLRDEEGFNNNAYWLNPVLDQAKESNCYGIGMDVDGGTIRLFDIWSNWVD